MQTIEALRRQIDSAEDLHSVVKTMKALAAVSIHQYEEATKSIRQYEGTVELGLQILARGQSAALQEQQTKDEHTSGVVVFGSAQGMCGQLNEDLVSFVLREMRERVADPGRLRLSALGHKASGLLEGEGFAVERQLTVPSSVGGITEGVSRVLSALDAWQSDGVGQVALCFNARTGGASYQPQWRQLLPLDVGWLRELAERPWQSRCLPTHRMSWPSAFAALVREHLFVGLYRAFAESLASENAARLAAMQGAESNIEERLEDLHGRYNHQRQNSITSELLDIASGYEALRDDEQEENDRR